jgi:hypothetical protein
MASVDQVQHDLIHALRRRYTVAKEGLLKGYSLSKTVTRNVARRAGRPGLIISNALLESGGM